MSARPAKEEAKQNSISHLTHGARASEQIRKQVIGSPGLGADKNSFSRARITLG